MTERFVVLEADPPWKFRDKLPGKGRGASKHYRVLSVEDICRFPLPPMADDSVLFLWRCAVMQQEALDVMRMWGFRLGGEIIWDKVTLGGEKHFGMGNIVRGAHEVCLLGVRGKWKPKVRNERSRFTGVVGRHSEKPSEFYAKVERMTAGPRARLFARSHRAGWTSFGDELT